ncbi:MAG: hypothetical protein ACR2KV_01760, partial [Solirubrobacteraceae bacterium]
MPETLDLPALATALGRRLRGAGVPVTAARSAHFARALTLVAPATRTELYWTARAVFVSSPAQVPVFDRVFAAVFDPRMDPGEDRGDPYSPPLDASQGSERAPSPGARSTPREPGSPEPAHMSAAAGAPAGGGEDAREVEVPLA